MIKNIKKRKPRTSPIWLIDRDSLERIVKSSTSFSEILKYFGLDNKGGNNKTLKNRCLEGKIDFSHINSTCFSNRGRKFFHTCLTKEESLNIVFIEKSKRSRNCVRTYLHKYNLIPYKCECENEGVWRDKKLSLQIDHINGECDDHRLENLRWMCPNCHAQTDTFTGKHKKTIGKMRIKPSILNPNWRIDPRPSTRKVVWPSKEELYKVIWEKPTSQLAKELGVSDISISDWCKKYGISKPPRGYWGRRKSGLTHEEALKSKPEKKSSILTKFTEEEANNIRKRLAFGESARKIAASLGCSRNAIDGIKNNPNYGSVWGKEKFRALV